jgi:hypothetical protein
MLYVLIIIKVSHVRYLLWCVCYDTTVMHNICRDCLLQ